MSLFRGSNAATDNHSTGWPVPQPRSAYNDLYDGPTERLYEPSSEPDEPVDDRAKPVRRGGVVFAVLISLLALAASAGASLIAWRALGAAKSAVPAAAAPTPAPAAAPSSVPSEAPVDPELAGPSADPSASDPGYAVSYAQEPLKVQVGCASVMYLDLDEPRANAEQQHSDLRYDSRCGTDRPTLTLAPGADSGSQVQSPDIDAPGCDKAIRTSPLGLGAGVPVQKGTVLCVLTSATDAEDHGERPRMVLLEVTDVGQDGTASMRATSWTVP